MLHKIQLSALRTFESAGRLGSFTAAADELGFTPSAVSHAIRNLEDALGVKLFIRRTRAVELSMEGAALMRSVERAFDELRRGMETVSRRTPRSLRLHCAPSFAAQFLAPRLPQFLTAHPGIEVRLAAGTDYTRFTTDEFDADITYGPVRLSGVETIPLGPEHVTPLCAPSLAETIKSPSDLLDQILIQSDNKQVRWPDWFAANGLSAPPLRGLRFDRSFLAIAAAREGHGIALESTLLASKELASGQLIAPLVRTSQNITYVGHHFVYPSRSKTAPMIKIFLTWLNAELAATDCIKND